MSSSDRSYSIHVMRTKSYILWYPVRPLHPLYRAVLLHWEGGGLTAAVCAQGRTGQDRSS